MVKRQVAPVTPDSEIYPEDVIASGLIPNLDPINLQYIGKNWYKDNNNGMAYNFIKDGNGVIDIKETRQSIAKTRASLKSTPKPKPISTKVKFVDIKCMDCGAIRNIHVQDAFQVKRCVSCQDKYRKQRRSERIKDKEVQAAG